MLVNRFVIRRNGVRERRGIPPALRNALRRLFIAAVERSALRDAEAFIAAANPDQQPPPPTNKVSFITTPRLNQFAMYIPAGAPLDQVLSANDYIARWASILESRGYSELATDPQWRLNVVEGTVGQSDAALFAWAGPGRIFFYGSS